MTPENYTTLAFISSMPEQDMIRQLADSIGCLRKM